MERWGIDIAKEHLKFSAAHFLIFPDGSAERLHGHNYRVFCELEAALSEHGLVIDFSMIKPVIKELVDRLDEHWLVPGEHPVLTVREDGEHVEVGYQGREYRAPREDVIVLPVNNTSSENLATWLGRELLELLEVRFPEVRPQWLRLSVEETAGQRGVWTWSNE